MAAIVNPPSFVEWRGLRFLIIDAPTDENLHLYIREFKKYSVQDVVRACEGSYATDPLLAAGITVHDMAFEDGAPPPADVIAKFLAVTDKRFGKNAGKASAGKADGAAAGGAGDGSGGGSGGGGGSGKPAVAVHCVAGLGRAPVLVATALIEAGMEPLKAVDFIRQKRRGAINARQLRYLERYKPRKQGRCVII
mmetsp:Transcript_2776/g.9794  ORF Transcript_2776/g.9794 Transcript_2776/m.9794 type:complete len:194 (-) Transcript_2776:309-890(-)